MKKLKAVAVGNIVLRQVIWVKGEYKGRTDIYSTSWIAYKHGFGVREIDGYEFLHRRENGGVTVDGNPAHQGTDYYVKKP